jgi:hypothetical protein
LTAEPGPRRWPGPLVRALGRAVNSADARFPWSWRLFSGPLRRFFDSVGWDEGVRSDSPEYLYYDRDTRLVGIGPAAKHSPAALNLKTGRGGRYYRVGVTGFMRPRVLPSGWAVRLRRLLCSAYFKKSSAAMPVTYRTLERTAPLMPSCNRPVRGKRSV